MSLLDKLLGVSTEGMNAGRMSILFEKNDISGVIHDFPYYYHPDRLSEKLQEDSALDLAFEISDYVCENGERLYDCALSFQDYDIQVPFDESLRLRIQFCINRDGEPNTLVFEMLNIISDAIEASGIKFVNFRKRKPLVKARDSQIETYPSIAPARPKKAESKVSVICERSVHCIPVLCIAGFCIVAIGAALKWEPAWRVGGGVFVSGFAIWGLANGTMMVFGFYEHLKKKGLDAFSEKPVRAILSHLVYLAVIVFFFYIGFGFLSMLLKMVASN